MPCVFAAFFAALAMACFAAFLASALTHFAAFSAFPAKYLTWKAPLGEALDIEVNITLI